MFSGKVVLENVNVRSSEMFGKMQEIFADKVRIVRSIYESPEFSGCGNPEMHLTSDGKKSCFMFNGTEPAKEFAEALSKRLKVTADVDSYIGFGIVYVPADKYEEAIQKGLNMRLLRINGGCWLDFYNMRASCENEQILAMSPHCTCIDNDGKLKERERIVIKTWCKALEKFLGQEIVVEELFSGKLIDVSIKRTVEAHLMHDKILDKIRKSGLVDSAPFDGYAYVDYYGKYIR